MTKKEINKMIIKEFIKTVNDRYKTLRVDVWVLV